MPYPKRMLIIVDPQIDFIDGTLPVPDAAEAMNALADYLGANKGKYSSIIVTADRHPYRHCSFVEEGGKWPRHCVHDSIGAAVWPALFTRIYDSNAKVDFHYKGQLPDREEYSIFQNPEAAEKIKEIFIRDDTGMIDICGLAGDVCVAATITDAIEIFGSDHIYVLTKYSPSIDDGSTLKSLIKKHHLSWDR